MKIILLIIAFISCGLLHLQAAARDFSAEIADVKSGIRQDAQASWWGFDAKDATKCLQNAIDSGVKKLTVDQTGSDWLIGPIKLRSGLELVFADGVVVRALPGGFKSEQDCLFSALDQQNITLRGEGKVVLQMNKKDYQDIKQYNRSEWRHVISLRGCENVALSNLTLKSSGGDGIYIGVSSKMPGCKSISIDRITADDHLRQGISVISAENLLIKNSKFINTKGVPPASGIDLEPFRPNQWLINNVIENCEFIGNNSPGIVLGLGLCTIQTEPISVTFKNCRSINNDTGVMILGSTTAVRGEIVFENCQISGNKHSSFLFNNQQDKALRITLKDCTIDNRKSEEEAIVFNNDLPMDIANIKFDNVTVLPGNSAPLRFIGMIGYGILALDGRLKIQKDTGETYAYDLAKFAKQNSPDQDLRKFAVHTLDLRKLAPLSNIPGNATASGNAVRFRKNVKILQYTDKAGDLQLDFGVQQIANRPINVAVTVKDCNGTVVDNFSIAKPEYSYILKANGKNLYTFDIDTKGNSIILKNILPGQAFAATNPIGIFGGRNQRLYFHVPAGVKEIRIEASADLREPASGKLLDSHGNAVDSFNKLEGSRQIRFDRTDASKAEIWSLEVSPMEDFSFRLGVPLLPVVSTIPENLLIEK